MVTSIARPSTTYSIDTIREDVRYLVQQGIVSRHQSIDTLLAYIPDRDRTDFRRELELNDYLLRDRIADLIPQERWQND
ncbi:DUF4327 family protein [Lyngbya sp. CCY1209]|uniref:DUF4327 family protein n=1 Tax=Lyngbya sp. CCY1209 TaxID=2886103 RepID=UPI002D201D73|nr:DUF4327 family protein [Lyngbya sp. CCY1209]MEB3883396.1 DUF4327 family protein [Lyngbya sp. CCY1209]